MSGASATPVPARRSQQVRSCRPSSRVAQERARPPGPPAPGRGVLRGTSEFIYFTHLRSTINVSFGPQSAADRARGNRQATPCGRVLQTRRARRRRTRPTPRSKLATPTCPLTGRQEDWRRAGLPTCAEGAMSHTARRRDSHLGDASHREPRTLLQVRAPPLRRATRPGVSQGVRCGHARGSGDA